MKKIKYTLASLAIAVAALVVVAIISTPGCGAPTHTTEQNLLSCASANLGQTVAGKATTLFDDVLQIISAGAAGWEAELDKLIVTFGSDTVACAVKLAANAQSATPTGAAAQTVNPAAARANAYIVQHGWVYR